MKIYVLIIIVFQLLHLGITIGSGKQDDTVKTILTICIFLPIFGRILGWW